MKLRRCEKNPILKPRGDDWESVAVFNCAAAYWDGKIHVLYRAVGDYVRYASSLGYAIFDEDLNLLKRSDEPIFGPNIKLWEMSIEDPRLTEVNGELYMTYVVVPTPGPPGAVRRRLGIPRREGSYPRTALAKIVNFREFTSLGVITPFGAHERDVVLFPEKIRGRYAAIHRPRTWIGPGYPVGRPSIWFAFLDGLPGRVYDHKVIMEPEQPWEGKKIGAGRRLSRPRKAGCSSTTALTPITSTGPERRFWTWRNPGRSSPARRSRSWNRRRNTRGKVTCLMSFSRRERRWSATSSSSSMAQPTRSAASPARA